MLSAELSNVASKLAVRRALGARAVATSLLADIYHAVLGVLSAELRLAPSLAV